MRKINNNFLKFFIKERIYFNMKIKVNFTLCNINYIKQAKHETVTCN